MAVPLHAGARRHCEAAFIVLEGPDKGTERGRKNRFHPARPRCARERTRVRKRLTNSYTRKLLDRGAAHCAKKFGEEAVETVIAAVDGDRKLLISETADLLYHLLIVLEARGVKLTEVEEELAKRTAQSGLEEKASRKRD